MSPDGESWASAEGVISLPSSKFLKKQNDRFDPPIKIGDVELLIRRMQVVVRQPESHHHAGNFQVPLEIPPDRTRPARTDKHRLLSEHLVQGTGCRLYIRIVGLYHDRIPGVDQADPQLDSPRLQ